MGRQVMSNKRMCVYSLETNKLVHLAFTRNYVHHLLPALKEKKIKSDAEGSTSSSSTTAKSSLNDEDGNADRLVKIVRFEVNMALALSAKQFAWSHALEAKLRREYSTFSTNRGVTRKSSFHDQITSSFIRKRESTAIFEEKPGESLALLPHNYPTFGKNVVTMPPKTSRNPRCDRKIMKKSSRTKSTTTRRLSRSRKGHGKKSEEDIVKDKLAHLRKLLPGGNEMGDNDEILLKEVASYITCLKLQVQVLHCLVEGQ